VSVEEDVAALRREVDTLQDALLKPKPWYKDIATWISVLAFVFSLGTTAVAAWRTHRQDRHDARLELRSLIARLVAVPRENAELVLRYPNSPSVSFISSILSAESQVLTRQAYDLAMELRNEITPGECLTIAAGFLNAGRFDLATKMYRLMESRADDPTDALGARRGLGAIAFQTGDLATGRKEMQSALDLFNEERFRSPSAFFRASSNFFTHLQWSQMELAVGNGKGADQQLLASAALIDEVRKWGGEQAVAPLQQQIAIVRTQIDSIPDGVPVPVPMPMPNMVPTLAPPAPPLGSPTPTPTPAPTPR
jgi:hypothetical protein